MKKLLLTIAAGLSLAFSAPLMASAPQADSCLKLVCPDTNLPLGWANPDSVRVDSCVSSPTYLKYFAYTNYLIIFPYGNYPFDAFIAKGEIKSTADISSKFPALKQKFLDFEVNHGKISFIRCLKEDSVADITLISSPRVTIYFDKYNEYVSTLDSILAFQGVEDGNCVLRFGRPLSAVETLNAVCKTIVTPNPVHEILQISQESLENGQKIQIMDQTGRIIIEMDYAKQIDVSKLSPGLYFLRTGTTQTKFIKE